MVYVYNTETVKDMDPSHIDAIAATGIPIEFYQTGLINLGPANKSAVNRAAQLGTILTEYQLPLPPSRPIEMFYEKLFGKSKLDFRMSMEGPPGSGKSVSFLYEGARYGEFTAYKQNGTPTDYFGLKTCALLEDSEGVTQLLDECEKRQAIVIDDAGVSVSHKDSQTQKNKNVAAIMQTCRTKRLLLLWNAPLAKHIDLQIRELIFAKGHIMGSFHAAGFNIAKINFTFTGQDGNEWKNRFEFDKKKIDFHLMFTPGIVGDHYKKLQETYESFREAAADALAHNRHIDERLRNNPIDTAKELWKKKMEKYYHVVVDTIEKKFKEGKKLKRTEILLQCPDLTEREVIRMIAIYNAKNRGENEP